MDAANLLKPMLARGELHLIGATTLDEYRKHIEKDAALERRFQTVLVDQPSVENTISILRGLKERYEVHHGVAIRDQGVGVLLVSSELDEVLSLSDRILVLYRGKFVGEFKRGEATERELGLKMGGAS